MNKKNKPHTRPNAKPRLPDAKRVNLFLDESTTENAKQIGNGNLSLGVRIAVKECHELNKFLQGFSDKKEKPTPEDGQEEN